MTAAPASTAKSSTVRVFLVDDHEIVRRGVRELLEAEPDISVVGEAGGVKEALVFAGRLNPDVAILDVRLGDGEGDGVSLCRELRSANPELACLMLTSFSDDEALFNAILAGAAGYVLKQIRGDDLVQAVRTVAAGNSLLDARATARVLKRIRVAAQHKADPLAVLSDQERRVLERVGRGLTNRQIGEELFLAEKTVKNYVSSVLRKLGLQHRVQAAIMITRENDAPS